MVISEPFVTCYISRSIVNLLLNSERVHVYYQLNTDHGNIDYNKGDGDSSKCNQREAVLSLLAAAGDSK